MLRFVSRRAFLTIIGLLSGSRTTKVNGQEALPAASPTPHRGLLDSAASDYGPVRAVSPYHLALLIPFPSDGFWSSLKETATERGQADGISLDVYELSEPSVPEQLGQIAYALSAGYDGILLGPVDARGIAPGLVDATEAGVPVISIDTAPMGVEVISVVRTDNVAAARRAGQYLGQELEEGTVLNIQGDMESPVAQERDEGLRVGLEDFEGISVMSEEGNWNEQSARDFTSAQLPQEVEGTPVPTEPLIDAIFAADPRMTIGAAGAVEEVMADTVFVVGFGATDETLDLISRGLIEAVVAEYPTRAGAISVDLMVKHLNGDSVPAFVDSGHALVLRENVDDFIASGAV